MASRLGFSQSEPKAATVSYSGPPYSGRTPPNGPSATRTTRVQPTGQARQARCPRRIVFFMAVPLIRSACSQAPVSQLRVGRMPAADRSSTPPAVPSAPALVGAVPQPRVLPDLGEVGEGELPERLRVGQCDPAGPADGNGLEILRPHHRAQPRAPRRPVGIVHDAGVAHPVLPGQADADDPGLAVAQLPLDRLLGLERPPPRQMGGRPNLHPVIDDGEVDLFRGLALHDDAVVAGVLELVGHEAAGVGLTEAAGRGGFRDDHEATRAGCECARQRTHREHQPILRPEGVAPPGDLVEQDPRPQTPAPEILARPGPVERFGPRLSGAEIHPEQSSCVSVHGIRLSRCMWTGA